MISFQKKTFLGFLIIPTFIFTVTSCNFSLKKASVVSPFQRIAVLEPEAKNKPDSSKIKDLLSFENILDVCRVPFTRVSIKEILKKKPLQYNIILVPNLSAEDLNSQELEFLRNEVKNGTGIITDSISPLTRALGLKFSEKAITVDKIYDSLYYRKTLYWPHSTNIFPIQDISGKASIIATDNNSGIPVIVSDTMGKGRYICFSGLLDPYTSKGYSRYPYLIELMDKFWGNIYKAERRCSEMYFDPGMYDTISSYDNLAREWRSQMIKRIYAGGWYYDDTEDVDYAQLIKACHENGILVYCWLEPPMISEKFWKAHPEWREKTATQRDAHVDWRLLMNLADSSCLNEVFKELKQCLNQYKWDGVNMAEMYFDPIFDGRQGPDNLTPMNSAVRNEFKNKEGFDPLQLFNTSSSHYYGKDSAGWKQYLKYRKELCNRLKFKYLNFLNGIAEQKKDFEFMLTVIDVSLTPDLSDYIGEDFKYNLELFKIFPITLQIEDPANCWGATPERYKQLGKYYSAFIKDHSRLVFDCNVVASHEAGFGGFPSEKPSGEEIRQIAYNMSIYGIRPAFYSADAFFSGDFKNINSTVARDVKIEILADSTLEITTPTCVSITAAGKDKKILLDNKEWRAFDQKKIIIIPGCHLLKITTENRDTSSLSITMISGDMLSAEFSGNRADFEYNENHSGCYVIVNHPPSEVYIDKKTSKPEILKCSNGEYSVKLPQGKHKVRLTQ
jgi:hypothetical protein